MCPSSVRISPDKPEPQPTSRMKEGTSGLTLVEMTHRPTVVQAGLSLEVSIKLETFLERQVPFPLGQIVFES